MATDNALAVGNPLPRVPMLVTPQGDKLHESAFILDYLDGLARAAGKAA